MCCSSKSVEVIDSSSRYPTQHGNYDKNLSDIIKNVISKRPKEPNKNKKNKIINNENDTKSKKFCSTNNSNNQLISRSLVNNNKKKIGYYKV